MRSGAPDGGELLGDADRSAEVWVQVGLWGGLLSGAALVLIGVLTMIAGFVGPGVWISAVGALTVLGFVLMRRFRAR
ncbi:hypothetical protein ACIP93_10330 [Streptomyces sp. NPDC088745]|uniref:hypothetical protein n=1 Tax=Streptomyces sp. NPDC088745 TaxID=3365884 RepID=UPI003804BCF1